MRSTTNLLGNCDIFYVDGRLGVSNGKWILSLPHIAANICPLRLSVFARTFIDKEARQKKSIYL